MFSPQSEIWAYLQGCAQKYGVEPYIEFGAEVIEARWNEGLKSWELRTRDGRRFSARVLIAAMIL